MFNVSDVARQQIAEYFQSREVSAIRVFYGAGG